MAVKLDLTYPNVLKSLERHLQKGRTESRAFLAWFLEHYYRLEDFQAADAVCDGPDDKGVDGIYVDDNFERIDILQSKLVQSSAKTLGDTQLKEFVGTLDQFRAPETIDKVASSTGNPDLKKLLQEEHIANKVKDGYAIRGVFVTNVKRDGNAVAFLATRADMVVYDHDALVRAYVPTEPTPPVQTPFVFDTFGYDTAEYKVGQAKVVIAPLLASQLIRLEGLANGELFAWNVRQSLGKTKVNKDIAKSILDAAEHKNFLLFHNGLTVLCQKVAREKDKIQVAGYAVVNGCQSLTTLHENAGRISNELRLMARLIELPPNDPLAERITHHSNNQNSISARDLQSNSTIQRRLQNEFAMKFGAKAAYQIKRGEAPAAAVIIDNEEAGRILLAFDLNQPWSCHQSYRVFDELHSEIFARPEVSAERVYALWVAYNVVMQAVPKIEDQLMGAYRLTRYVVLFLLRKALEQDAIGKVFCSDPGKFLREKNGEAHLGKALTSVVADIIVDLDAESRDRAGKGNPLDYKREFKSQNAIRELERNIIPMYLKAIQRDRASAFGIEWSRRGVQ